MSPRRPTFTAVAMMAMFIGTAVLAVWTVHEVFAAMDVHACYRRRRCGEGESRWAAPVMGILDIVVWIVLASVGTLIGELLHRRYLRRKRAKRANRRKR